jgi:N utilization substance protein A
MEGNEILAVVDSVSNEKGLEKDSIFEAIETAIASASQRHFHEDAVLHVKIDRVSGTYKTLGTGLLVVRMILNFILRHI